MKKNFEKMFAEYELLKKKGIIGDNGYSLEDFSDLLKFAEATDKNGSAYVIHTHPVWFAYVAFRIGYVAALRKAKALEKKENCTVSAELLETGKRLIKARGNTPLREVCNTIGITASSLRAYEAGQREPRDEIKRKLADYYGMTVAKLFF